MHIKSSQKLATNHTLIARLPYFGLQSGILLLLLIAGSLSACQPPSPTESIATSENTDIALSPIVIREDSVTMAPEYILSIKPTRYQPSLGLQGQIEAIKSIQLTATHDLQIQKVLVTHGQWVEKGTPLLIVARHTDTTPKNSKTITSATPQADNQNNDNVDDNAGDDADNDETSLVKNSSDVLAKSNHPPASSTSSTTDTVTNNTVNNAASNTDNQQTSNTSTSAPHSIIDTAPLITVRASFSGRVSLYRDKAPTVSAGDVLLQLSDDRNLRFIATLPIQAESQLSIGQNVNFTVTGLTDNFTGQVSKLTVNQQTNKLLVNVHVVKNDVSRGKLRPNMAVSGRVDYGQIEVGTVVPEQGIHDVDLAELKKPPYKPLSPLTANVWIIKQDQRLTRQAVEVIEYDPSTGQYLIAGVSNDSLICLADLPLETAGKKAVIS